jgi:O-methyltransferase
MPFLGRARSFDVLDASDYIRASSLELVAHEVNTRKVPGAIAELGVFRGDFAEKISKAFPDRTFYLFDTFEGFTAKDVEVDREHGFSTADQSFTETSVQLVMQRIESPDRCIVRSGWFPESAASIDDQFAFVSLDADLYQPTYEGLRFFYPRLARGGYIFCHDYNNKNYLGVREALRKFCAEEGTSFFPLSDENGTAVVSK